MINRLLLCILIILLPLIIIIAFAILNEDGYPFFFTQKCVGINYSFFYIFKFRSMSGGIVFRNGGPVGWLAERQEHTSLSSCEAEIRATNEGAKLTIALRNLADGFADCGVTLLDANGKKTRFCQQVKTELKLDNVTVVHSRLEDYAPEVKHDGITSRAFTTLRDMTEKSVSCCALGGYYFAMKGIYPTEELAELPPSIETTQVIPIDALGQSGQRHLVVLKQKA